MTRYDRQMIIDEWDQSKLENASIVLIGAGATGNWVALALCGLGIGNIKIIDYDSIELHNLNRQCAFTESDVNSNKAEALANRITERNSDIIAVGINEKITEENISDIIGTPNIIIDCVDVIWVRRVLYKYCVEKNIPLIHGGISWNGWEVAVLNKNTPCPNCIYPKSLQEAEKSALTSCTAKPQSSVVYTGEMCASMIVEFVRKILLPLKGDKPYEGKMYVYDSSLDNPLYVKNLKRLENCEDCLPLLKKIDVVAYKKALAEIKKQKEIPVNLSKFL